jgi:hypothetical protein
MTLNAAYGVINGYPQIASNSWTFVAKVTDSLGATATQTLSMAIAGFTLGAVYPGNLVGVAGGVEVTATVYVNWLAGFDYNYFGLTPVGTCPNDQGPGISSLQFTPGGLVVTFNPGFLAGVYTCQLGGTIGAATVTFFLQFTVLPQLLVTQVQFTNSYALATDVVGSPLAPISNIVWQSSCSGSSNCSNPSAFAQGTTIAANVTFSLSFEPSAGISNLRIEGAVSGLGTLSYFVPSIPAGVSSIVVPVTASAALPTGTRIYNPMTINWQYALSDTGNAPCSQVGCLSAGSSASTVYVTMATPSVSYMTVPWQQTNNILPLPLTVLGLAVNPGGAATPADAFKNTWNQFSNGLSPLGPANVLRWNSTPLYYYESGVGFNSCATDPIGLLTSPLGSGQCGSFALLFMWALAANGISSKWVQITPAADSLMLVENWQFSQTPHFPSGANPADGPYAGAYKWQLILQNDQGDGISGMVTSPPSGPAFGDLRSAAGVAGQNSMTPSEKAFGSHFIVEVNNSLITTQGPYFDPSYGKTYANNCDFETQDIAGYASKLDADPSTGFTYHAKQSGSPSCSIVFAPPN